MLKRYLLTGLLIWVPLAITVWVLVWIMALMDSSLLLLPARLQPEALLGFYLPGLGMILTVCILLLTGIVATNLAGQRLVHLGEALLQRIPVVKSIYSSVKQVSDTLLKGGGDAFRRVLLVRYPHPDAWAVAFQTGMPPRSIADLAGNELVSVFIPTAPSPVNGFFFFVKKADTIELDISVDAALKYIISMGVVAPGVKAADT